MMVRLPLAQYGIPASQLVLGCMPFGGGWNNDPVSDEHILQAERAIDAALSIGISMFDHADIYTRGKAEETFGRVLKSRSSLREQIVLQSKCGIRLGDNGKSNIFDFSKDHILKSVDGSLKRLNTDYLDILLLHRPDPLMEPDEIAEAFSILKEAGKVRFFGVSNMSVAQIRYIERSLNEKLIVNQLELSLAHLHWLDQSVHVNQTAGTNVHFSEGLLEYCQSEGIQIQSWGPLAQGKFSGRSVEQASESVQKTAALVANIAAAKETTKEAIVLAWLMRHPAHIQPIIGTINPERIVACQDAERQAQLMTREEWYELYTTARGANMP